VRTLRHQLREPEGDILVTRVFRRGFRPPESFGAGRFQLVRPVAIVTASGLGLRTGSRFAWYPISDILLVTPGPTAVCSARIDFLDGSRADLRVEQQWLFNRRLREAVHAFELDYLERTAGYEWSLGETVHLMAQAEVLRGQSLGAGARNGGPPRPDGSHADAAEELRHRAWVEELRQRRRMMLRREPKAAGPASVAP
jgi:hypothetical protein